MKGSVTVRGLTAQIEEDLQQAGDPLRAEKEKAYLKSDLKHLGVRVPEIRRVVKRSIASLDRDLAATLELAETLWDRPIHESRMAAVDVLMARAELLDPSDLRLVESFIRSSKTWALVDPLATSVTGPVVQNHPPAAAILDRWSEDDDFWIRRAAMLALLKPLRSGAGDFERFARYADAMLEEREFFIRKAIGWVLRETSKQDPEIVYEWLSPRATRASGVTVREAVRYLSAEQSAEIVASYRRGRRASGESPRKRPRK
jgi:3-methyladenine DNA glycosylase AlkD